MYLMSPSIMLRELQYIAATVAGTDTEPGNEKGFNNCLATPALIVSLCVNDENNYDIK